MTAERVADAPGDADQMMRVAELANLETALDELDDATHARLDTAVLNVADDEPSVPSRAAFLLATIVSTSEGQLDLQYEKNLIAKALIDEHPELMDKLKEAWAARTFRGIRNLKILRPSTAPAPRKCSSTEHVDSTSPHTPPQSKKPLSTPDSPKNFAVSEGRIENVISCDLREKLRRHVDGDITFPTWNPPDSWDDDVRRHILRLRLPALYGYPLLLLHGLGRAYDDRELSARIAKVFDHDAPTFLCNTSGSGKTRIIFEHLSKNWGLYFTAGVAYDGVGSGDLENALGNVRQFLRGRDSASQESRDVIQELCTRRLMQVLFARLYVFEHFLQTATEQSGGITEEHKIRWLFLQISPMTLVGRDVFRALAYAVSDAMLSDLQAQCAELLERIRTKIGSFCLGVLDEAKAVLRDFHGWFRSRNNEDRPVLRHIIETWSPHLRMILSGTGISMRELEEGFASAVANEGGLVARTVVDTGAFDTAQQQLAYVRLYVPKGFLDTETGKELASRITFWLRGRYRLTATYITRLIRNGFESPHRVLNTFILAMTGYQPSDGDDLCDEEPELEPADGHKKSGFNFSSLMKEGKPAKVIRERSYSSILEEVLVRQVAGSLFDYIFAGKARSLGGEDIDKLVEYGFARFQDHYTRGQADEPLALLAAADLFSQNTSWTMEYFIHKALTTIDPQLRGHAFENFVMYQLALAFKKPRVLSEVFSFLTPTPLGEQKAHLVSAHKVGSTLEFHAVDISPPLLNRPVYCFGQHHSTEKEVLSSLLDPKRTCYCFPGQTVGPDGILLLMGDDQKSLGVILSMKYCSGDTLDDTTTIAAFRATDPMMLLSQGGTPAEREIRNEQKHEAIANLCASTSQDGTLGVIRAVAAYPAQPYQVKKTSEGKYPLAIVKLEEIAMSSNDLQMLLSLKGRKRKAVD